MFAGSDGVEWCEPQSFKGRMGTGMPEFGSLYSDEELWAMITYLRTFLFAK